MSSDRTSPTFPPCPECRIVGAHRFDCSLNPRTRAATPEQLQAVSRPPGVPPDASPRGEPDMLDAWRLDPTPSGSLDLRGPLGWGCVALPRGDADRRAIALAILATCDPACAPEPLAWAIYADGDPEPFSLCRTEATAAKIVRDNALTATLVPLVAESAPTPPIASPALTVGAALADPRVQDGECVAESVEGGAAQVAIVSGDVRARCLLGGAWTRWAGLDTYKPTLLAQPCSLVPVEIADDLPRDRPLASPRPAEAEREGTDPSIRAVGDFIDGHAQRLAEQAGHVWNRDDEEADEWASAVHDVLNNLRADENGEVYDGRPGRRTPTGPETPPTPTRAIAAPGLDLPARVAALLAVADRATPGPLVLCDRCREQNGGRPFPGCAACWPRRPPAPQPADFDRGVDILRDAPALIRELQAEIERRGKLVEEACGLLDREAGFAQHPFRARLTAEIERLRAMIGGGSNAAANEAERIAANETARTTTGATP